ncbi:MAG: ABC transporter substrate binding protein [Pseudomonadota bacterium]|nr:ABC transporter substrate binding protein [Pseudomonadota bacterium]
MRTAMNAFLVLMIVLALSACQSLTTASDDLSRNATVLVINSDATVPRYQVAEQAFRRSLHPAQLAHLDLSHDPLPVETLLDYLQQHRPEVIYCIGAKALGSVQSVAPGIPVVYSSVLSWRQFLKEPNYYGVTSEIAPAAQLAWFKHFFPGIKRIGVFSSSANQDLIREARISADVLSLTLVTETITAEGAPTERANRLLSQVDALWILPDPVALKSPSQIKKLFDLAHASGIPVLGYHPVFMEFGATMSISADLATTGRQAALIAESLLQQNTKSAPIQFPAGSDIALNLKKVQDYRLELNPEALNSVNELTTAP